MDFLRIQGSMRTGPEIHRVRIFERLNRESHWQPTLDDWTAPSFWIFWFTTFKFSEILMTNFSVCDGAHTFSRRWGSARLLLHDLLLYSSSSLLLLQSTTLVYSTYCSSSIIAFIGRGKILPALINILVLFGSARIMYGFFEKWGGFFSHRCFQTWALGFACLWTNKFEILAFWKSSSWFEVHF